MNDTDAALTNTLMVEPYPDPTLNSPLEFNIYRYWPSQDTALGMLFKPLAIKRDIKCTGNYKTDMPLKLILLYMYLQCFITIYL